MGLITGIVTFPLAPVRGVAWLAERIKDQAESELYDPAVIRRQLEEVDDARRAGEISEDEAAESEEKLLSMLFEAR